MTSVFGRPRLAAGVAIVVLPWLVPLASCDRSPPEIHAPQPELRPDTVLDVLDRPLASLAAAVMYDLTEVLGDLEEEVPLAFGNLDERHDHPDRESLTFAYEAVRSPFDAEVVGDTARLSATLEYGVKAWYDPPVLPEVSVSCGTGEDEPRPKAVVELSSPLGLSHDWVLVSRARVERVAPASMEASDRCEITAFGIDVTGTVMEAATALLEDETTTIDEKVAESARGTVYLVGTPEIDHGTRMIHVPDLEFDVDTRNLLVGGIAWLARSNFAQFLRERARIPIADVMAPAEEQLRKGINRQLSDDVAVEGEVLGSHLIDVVATREALVVRAGARARASLHVHPVLPGHR